jgi:hypothetical protein
MSNLIWHQPHTSRPPPDHTVLVVVAVVAIIAVLAIIVMGKPCFQCAPEPPKKANTGCGLEPSDCPRVNDEVLTSYFDRCTALEHHSPDACLTAWDMVHPDASYTRIFAFGGP